MLFTITIFEYKSNRFSKYTFYVILLVSIILFIIIHYLYVSEICYCAEKRYFPLKKSSLKVVAFGDEAASLLKYALCIKI